MGMAMKWIKKGLIFKSENNYDWMVSHAAIPVVDEINGNVLRIYFSSRDKKGRSRPTYIEVKADNPQKILNINDYPILPLGKLGTFDDNGIMPSWIVNYDNKKYLYYIGWNPQVTVSYRLSIGLAISEDDGESFYKYSDGPISDRAGDEPYFCTAPSVVKEDDLWRMWYVSCTGWTKVLDWPEPYYHIKYAESNDGINWNKTGIICIDYDELTKAIGRPCVFKENNMYKMIYSYRGIQNYRTDSTSSYRLGYAESEDGLTWIRKDSEIGIELSAEGWDSIMLEYCSTYLRNKTRYLLYNGNGFGESGFGYAELQE